MKYLVRAYPGARGLWTALEVRARSDYSPEGIPEDVAFERSYGSRQPVKIARSEFVPIDFSVANRRRYWGLYNDPGHRVNTQDMVREEVKRGWPLFQDERNDWASGVVIESGDGGFIVVKESNKTVNVPGHQTGAFYCTPSGLEVTGWGLKPAEIVDHEFRRTWATWTILYDRGDDEWELALKEFDRLRYPAKLERDMHIVLDTWSSDWREGEDEKIYGRENSAFPIVAREIESAADLGIDILRIDDGWQVGGTRAGARGARIQPWDTRPIGAASKPSPTSTEYASGCGRLSGISRKTNCCAISEASVLPPGSSTSTIWTIGSRSTRACETHATSCRRPTAYRCRGVLNTMTRVTDGTARCATTVQCTFRISRTNLPAHLVYVPYVTLRHHWMMAKYYNLNALQCHWANPARTNPQFSDAPRHSQSYAAMTAFVGSPSCYMLTQYLTPAEREELKETIGLYKQHRAAIYQSFVLPIGEEPSNDSWTGFQMHRPEEPRGHLLIFRELHNLQAERSLALKHLRSRRLRLRDLSHSGATWEVVTNQAGELPLSIPSAPDYRFLEYTDIGPAGEASE